MPTVTETEVTPKERITAWAEKHGVTMRAEFVPFSQSRNKGEKSPSLNWRVTLERNGRDILTTDYSAGIAHCPSYMARQAGQEVADASIAREYCAGISRQDGTPILPDLDGVLWSLSMDSSVLDAGGFESWASEFGYDADSRAAEAIYRACIDTALKMRAALGDAAMAELAEAGQDY